MAYIAPVHKATSIRHAVRMKFLSPDEDDLVVAKANRLEIWRLTDDGLTQVYDKHIYGAISMLQRFQPKDEKQDVIFIGTDRLEYFNVAWDPEKKELAPVEQRVDDTAEPYMRQAQTQNKCLVDPTGRFMVMHLWEGVINVCRLPTRKNHTKKLEVLAQVRLSELWLRTSTFLHSRTGHPIIAFLYQTRQNGGEAKVAVYRVTKDDRGSDAAKFDPQKDREYDEVMADPHASMLIPVPIYEEKRYHVRNHEGSDVHLGGLLVIGETLLTYIDSLTWANISIAVQEPKIYVAWAEYDETHYLLADDYGRLDLLTLETEPSAPGVVTGISVKPMQFPDSSNQTSRASQLVYMDNDKLFVASHHGDSQLLHLDIEAQTMMLQQRLDNNAPILDFAIMDMGNREGDTQAGNAFSSGQARIVAGCGAYQDGSLRSIRSGVGLHDYGILDEVENVRGLFTLQSYGSEKDDTICVSLINETRIFRFDPEGEIEEVYTFQGLVLDSETLLASNLPNGQMLQVTPHAVFLLDTDSGVAVSTWTAPEGKSITAASANEKWALLSIEGLTLISLNLRNNLVVQIKETGSTEGFTDQMSCIHAGRYPLDLGVVGWWSSGTITVVDLATLQPLHGEKLRSDEDSACVPRDIALVQLHVEDHADSTLLIATEDGSIVTFNISVKGFAVTGRKTVTLGTSPARLHILPRGHGTSSIFATTEHPSLIYSADGRIIYAATTARGATFATPFDSEAYPDSLILSTDKHIRLSRVDRERRTHTDALHVNETVRRVAYSPNLRAFGLGCVKKELIGNEEKVTSTFKLVDEILFEVLGKPYELDASTGFELVECVIRAVLTDSTGKAAERFIVGTSFIPDGDVDEADKTRGRILVLGVNEDREPYLIASHKLKGSCRCLWMIDGGYVVAGLSKTVIVYNYVESTPATGSLQKLATHRVSSLPVDLDVAGNVIGISDLKQSLALVEFTPAQDGADATLREKARNYQAAWSTSVCSLGDEKWLEADAQGNLLVLRRNTEAKEPTERMKLDIISEINIGEQINRIRKLQVAPAEDVIVQPKAFLGSTEGSLYLYGEIAPKYQDLFLNLQERMAKHTVGLGSLGFDSWRAYRNEIRESDNGPFRFIDGEFIEWFLDLREEKQNLICEGLGPSVEDMRNYIEELRRMH